MSAFKALLVACLLGTSATAHFILGYPTSLGFDDDLEPTAPCGGFSIPAAGAATTANSTNVTVGGFAVALQSFHPAADFLFRASTDLSGNDFVNIVPVISETGLGQFCLPALTLPNSFVGKTGLIQVIQDGPDGILYQCAVANFVTGVNSTIGSACTNATGLVAMDTNQANFTSGASSSAASVASTASATGAATSLSASTSPGASATAGSATSAAASAAATTKASGAAGSVTPKWAGLAALLAVPAWFL